jgi:DNA-binding beta-propeller fold protein YncE
MMAKPKGEGGKMRSLIFAGCAAAAIAVGGALSGASGQSLIVGNDEKQGWDENGKPILREPGHDTLSVIDISKPDAPRIAATIPLVNSVVGPPTNLAITPSGDMALVANSLEPVVQGWGHRLEPDNKVFLIDLKANPPAVIGTITVGKQPSGMAISPKGDLALVANRADGTISVLSIKGKDVLVTDTVTIGAGADQVSAVAITPDGKHALAVKSNANKVALLSIDGEKVTYDKRDLPAGIFPYNIAVTPDGKLALTADTGNGGSSDGNVDTVSVIDLEANPPRVINHVTVGDSPEGLVISPKGDLAVSIEARGSNMPKTAFFYHPVGAVTALKIDGKRVTNVGDINVGGLPEGAAFSPDGQYLYVGNFIDGDLWVLRIDGSQLTDTTQRIKLPGHPASMRSGPQ